MGNRDARSAGTSPARTPIAPSAAVVTSAGAPESAACGCAAATLFVSAALPVPAVMGAESPQALTDELKASFCAADPYISRRFAAATFLGDNRADLPRLTRPALIIQCTDDAIAPRVVGEYTHAQLKDSTLRLIEATGHCPHMTHPQETIALIRDYIA